MIAVFPQPERYNKRPLPDQTVAALVEKLTRELGVVERAIRDTNLTPTRTLTANATLTDADGLVLVDATAGALTISLPELPTFGGRTFRIKKIDASANVVTVATIDSALIDGAATYPLPTQYASVTVTPTATAWWIE